MLSAWHDVQESTKAIDLAETKALHEIIAEVEWLFGSLTHRDLQHLVLSTCWSGRARGLTSFPVRRRFHFPTGA